MGAVAPHPQCSSCSSALCGDRCVCHDDRWALPLTPTCGEEAEDPEADFAARVDAWLAHGGRPSRSRSPLARSLSLEPGPGLARLAAEEAALVAAAAQRQHLPEDWVSCQHAIQVGKLPNTRVPLGSPRRQSRAVKDMSQRTFESDSELLRRFQAALKESQSTTTDCDLKSVAIAVPTNGLSSVASIPVASQPLASPGAAVQLRPLSSRRVRSAHAPTAALPQPSPRESLALRTLAAAGGVKAPELPQTLDGRQRHEPAPARERSSSPTTHLDPRPLQEIVGFRVELD